MGVGWKTGVREPCWPVPALETQTGCGTPDRLRQPSASGRGPQRTPCLRERRREAKRTVGKGSEPARDVTLVCGRRDGQLTRGGRLPAPRGTFGDASRWPACADRSCPGRLVPPDRGAVLVLRASRAPCPWNAPPDPPAICPTDAPSPPPHLRELPRDPSRGPHTRMRRLAAWSTHGSLVWPPHTAWSGETHRRLGMTRACAVH